MKRIIMMVLRLGLLSVYFFTVLCFKSKAKIKNFDKNYQWIRKVTTKVNKAGKVKIVGIYVFAFEKGEKYSLCMEFALFVLFAITTAILSL